jgi:hypothetical protein
MVIIFLCLSSCALLFNEKSQCLKIRTDSTLNLVKVDTTKLLYHEPGDIEYYVKRGKQPLKLDFVTKDSLKVSYYLKKKLSPAFALANISTGMIGYAVDLFHPKRFMYAPQNYFSYDTLQKQIVHSVTKPVTKGYTKFFFGWNYLSLYDAGLYSQKRGDFSTLGLNLGAEYFLTNNQSLQLEVGQATSGTVPSKKRQINASPLVKSRTSNFWLLLNFKKQYQRFSIGTGICFAGLKRYDNWKYYSTYDSIVTKPSDTLLVTKYIYSKSTMQPLIKAGLNLKLDFCISELIVLGCNWQLYLSDINKAKFYASHFFNFYVSMNVFDYQFKHKKTKVCQ